MTLTRWQVSNYLLHLSLYSQKSPSWSLPPILSLIRITICYFRFNFGLLELIRWLEMGNRSLRSCPFLQTQATDKTIPFRINTKKVQTNSQLTLKWIKSNPTLSVATINSFYVYWKIQRRKSFFTDACS